MAYLLDEILRVRIIRENKARNLLVQSKKELFEAKQKYNQRDMELSNYQSWRKKKEKELFIELKVNKSNSIGLIAYNEKLLSFKKKEELILKKVNDAEADVNASEENLKTTKAQFIAIYRKKVTLEEHKVIWEEAQRLQSEKEAEKELDDFRCKGPVICQ